MRRAFNYVVKKNLIDRNPAQGVDKPTARKRDKLITQEQFDELLSHVKDEHFADILKVIWFTGCRPQEAVAVEAKHVQENCWFFPEGKGGKPRLVFLNDEALAITQKWMERTKAGPIFRNTRGNPWTAMAFNNRFCTLKDKIGMKVNMYAIRHSYAHHGLTEGDVSPEVMAALLGHSNTGMIYKVYGHLLKNKDFMREAAKKVRE